MAFCLRGQRWLLCDVVSMKRKARLQQFTTAKEKLLVVIAFLHRKLSALKKGVSWKNIPGSRIPRKDFPALKKHGLRSLQGHVKVRYRKGPRSHFLQHKLAVHLVLAGKPIASWDQVPAWSNGSGCFVPSQYVTELLQKHAPRPLSSRERRLLITEVHTAAWCSYRFLFGRKLS